MFIIPHDDHSVDFTLQLHLLILVVVNVPLGQSGLALSVLQQNEPDLCYTINTILFKSIYYHFQVWIFLAVCSRVSREASKLIFNGSLR